MAQVVVGSSPTGHLAIVAELAYARDLNSRFLWVRLPPVAQPLQFFYEIFHIFTTSRYNFYVEHVNE